MVLCFPARTGTATSPVKATSATSQWLLSYEIPCQHGYRPLQLPLASESDLESFLDHACRDVQNSGKSEMGCASDDLHRASFSSSFCKTRM